MTYLTVQTLYRNGKPIVHNTEGRIAIHSVVVSADYLQADLEGNKVFPEGGFLVASKVGADYTTRFLPRTRLAAITNTGSANISLATPNQQFVVGDVLYAKACYAKLKFLGTYAGGSVVQLKYNGKIYTSATGASAAATVTQIVTDHATALLTDEGVTITAVGDTLQVFGRDSADIAAYTTLPAAFIGVETTEPGYLGDTLAPLGTILSIGAPNATTGVRIVTLAANAAYVVPAGCAVGINHGAILGIYPDQVDVTNEKIRHLSCVQQISGVYQGNLPYCDESIRRALPDLFIFKRFYAE
jgi:hypothetical protein